MKSFYLAAFTCLFLFVSNQSFEQELKGKVTEPGGQPVPSVNVVATGNKGTMSNEQGAYDLILSACKHKVTFSSIGYENKTVEVTLAARETRTLDVELASASSQLNEVVVTGTRSVGRTKLETASPVDVLDIRALAGPSPQVI